MSYIDRIQEASYKAPDGTIIDFSYEDVERELGTRSSAFELIGVSATYVQQNGVTGQRIPLVCIFHGVDYDLKADAFFALLAQNGVGILSHPRYGTLDVVPFGPINQSDRLKSGAGETKIKVTFYQTIRDPWAGEVEDIADKLQVSISQYNDLSAANFANNVVSDDESSLFQQYNNALDSADDALESIVIIEEDIQDKYEAIESSINRTLDVLISKPLDIAFQASLLLQAPANSASLIEDKLSSYQRLASDIINQSTTANNITETSKSNSTANADLWASGAMIGASLAVVSSSFSNRRKAIEAAESLSSYFNDYLVTRDDLYRESNAIDYGDSFVKLNEVVSLALNYMISLSYTLDIEIVFTPEEPRAIADLLGRTYGSIDDNDLDSIIEDSGLLGEDIIFTSKEIIYYE